VTCNDVVRDEQGNVVELRCTWDPGSRGGDAPDGRKVRGTLHWVSAQHAASGQVRLYERLFTAEDPMAAEDFKGTINPDSLETVAGCMLEPSLAHAEPGSLFQFERLGYFCADSRDSRPGAPVFNRTVELRDTWARIEAKLG
jgi:glutaminyl-tRNA synthetase